MNTPSGAVVRIASKLLLVFPKDDLGCHQMCIRDSGYGEGFDPDEAYGEPEYLSEDDFDDKDSK